MPRALEATSLGVLSLIFAFAASFGLTASGPVSIAIALLTAIAVGASTYRHLPLAPSACTRGLLVVSGVATLLALVVVGRLSVFMVDSSRPGFSSIPSSTWELQHSCLSAYYVAGRAVSTAPNVYDDALYSLPSDAKAPRLPRKLGLFNID